MDIVAENAAKKNKYMYARNKR